MDKCRKLHYQQNRQCICVSRTAANRNVDKMYWTLICSSVQFGTFYDCFISVGLIIKHTYTICVKYTINSKISISSVTNTKNAVLLKHQVFCFLTMNLYQNTHSEYCMFRLSASKLGNPVASNMYVSKQLSLSCHKTWNNFNRTWRTCLLCSIIVCLTYQRTQTSDCE